MLPCIIIARWLPPFKMFLLLRKLSVPTLSMFNSSLMKIQVYTSCSCFCCCYDFFTASRFLSCTVPKRRLCRLLINLVLLIALSIFTLLTLVCRRLSKDRIGFTELLCQCPLHGDSEVSSMQMVHFVLGCPRFSSSSCRLLGLNWELWVEPGSTVHWLLIPLTRL